MKIGFYNPFTGSVGGGDRYLYSVLELATRIRDAELFVLSPGRPDPRTWLLVGVNVGAGAFEWRPTADGQLASTSADLDLLVTLAIDIPERSAARKSVAIIQFPFVARDEWRYRWTGALAGLVGRRRGPAALASYQRFICYSEFARGCIRHRIGVEAEVIHPPVDMPLTAPGLNREQWIVSVGRFRRVKRHDVLIDAFRALGAEGWQLHLAGTSDGAMAGWLDTLRQQASGLAVEFHVNGSRDEVLDLYSRSSLYWHAAGFDVDPVRYPERLEHFGISTVEAMAAGTVPFVIPEGGQAEVVRDDVNGRFWRTIPELVAGTRELIDSPADWQILSTAAATDVRRYDTKRFNQEVWDQILSPASS